MTPSPTSPPAGLAELTQSLAALAHLPAVVVVLDGDMPAGYAHTRRGGHHDMPVLVLPAGMGDVTPAVAGVVAHEIAHHHLPVASGWMPKVRATAMAAGLVAAGAVVLDVLPWSVCAAIAVVALVAYGALRTAELWVERREEYAADAASVRLLDAAGLPGLVCARAALGSDEGGDPWPRRWVWLWDTHPPVARRLAALAALD